MASQSCRGCECKHLGSMQRRKPAQQAGQGILGTSSKTWHQDDFPKVQVLHHGPSPQQVFSFLVALWTTSSWQSQQVLGLGRTLSSCASCHFLPTQQSCSHSRLLSVFCCLVLSCLRALVSSNISAPTSFSSLNPSSFSYSFGDLLPGAAFSTHLLHTFRWLRTLSWSHCDL